MNRGRYWQALDRCRRRLLIIALRKFNGRVMRAADHLGVDRAGMYSMMKDHGVDPNGFRPVKR